MSTTTTTTTERKMYTVMSWDNEPFEIEESAAMMSLQMKEIIEAGCSDNTIHLRTEVFGPILRKIVDYCQKHVAFIKSKKADDDDSSGVTVAGKDDLKEWDEAFIDVDQEMLLQIIWIRQVGCAGT